MQEGTLSLRIKKIIPETPDTRTFVLEPIESTPLTYQPGQFLTFLLDVNGHEVRRSYSMSSAPGVDALPAVTIKRVANGEISRYWHDHVEVGTLLKALPSAGRFTLEPADGTARDIVLIGAGSGITPLFSLLKYVLTNESESRVTLLYASRRERSIIFGEQLDEWQQRYPERLEIMHVLKSTDRRLAGDAGTNQQFPVGTNDGKIPSLPPGAGAVFPLRAVRAHAYGGDYAAVSGLRR